jgi:hypothetical protein
MKTRIGIVASAALALLISHGFGYSITPWSYEDLFAKSDFVVIASPLTRPRETSERMTLEKITPPVPVIGVNTEFKTLLVLKGSERQRFVLHHYRDSRKPDPNKVILGGPDLLDFEGPTDASGSVFSSKRYLLFLVREADDRFAPVSGQQDPRGISVQELGGVTVDD